MCDTLETVAHIWGTMSQHVEWNYFHVHDSQYKSILIYIRSSWHKRINAFALNFAMQCTLIFNKCTFLFLSFKIALQCIWHTIPKCNLGSLKDSIRVLRAWNWCWTACQYQLTRLVTQPLITTNTIWKACRCSRMERLLPHDTAYRLGVT